MAQERERPATPEKQLLNLIEEPKASGITPKKGTASAIRLLSPAALRGRFSFIQGRIQALFALKKTAFDIKGVNKILQFCIVILSFWAAGSFMKGMNDIKNPPDVKIERFPRSGGIIRSSRESKKIARYLEKPRERDIFQFGGIRQIVQEEAEQPEQAPPPLPSAAEELVDALRLVGIGWSDDPDVMLQDTNTQKMYFLKTGQWIDNKVKVNTIFKDRVILFYDGKEVDLR